MKTLIIIVTIALTTSVARACPPGDQGTLLLCQNVIDLINDRSGFVTPTDKISYENQYKIYGCSRFFDSEGRLK